MFKVPPSSEVSTQPTMFFCPCENCPVFGIDQKKKRAEEERERRRPKCTPVLTTFNTSKSFSPEFFNTRCVGFISTFWDFLWIFRGKIEPFFTHADLVAIVSDREVKQKNIYLYLRMYTNKKEMKI